MGFKLLRSPLWLPVSDFSHPRFHSQELHSQVARANVPIHRNTETITYLAQDLAKLRDFFGEMGHGQTSLGICAEEHHFTASYSKKTDHTASRKVFEQFAFLVRRWAPCSKKEQLQSFQNEFAIKVANLLQISFAFLATRYLQRYLTLVPWIPRWLLALGLACLGAIGWCQVLSQFWAHK